MQDAIRKHDGKMLPCRRNGLYQARIHMGKNGYAIAVSRQPIRQKPNAWLRICGMAPATS